MKIILGLLFSLLITLSSYADVKSVLEQSDAKKLIQEMVKEHNFVEEELISVFEKVKYQDSIVKAIQRPYEAQPWYKYRTHFLTEDRMVNGVKFWKKHAATLKKVSDKYGVPENIIVAIIGVETNYGNTMGNHRVIDALSTLAFYYPPRANFFRKELKQYLLLTRENKLDPHAVKGSYAGAIGQPQFMPSSYRHYAAGFEHNGSIDLINSTEDAIASVANYLKENGWRRGEIITLRAKVEGDKYKDYLQKQANNRKPENTLAQLAKYNIHPTKKVTGNPKATVVKLDTGKGTEEFWLGFHDFYVITRYNTSNLYAMAVYQLGQEIEARM